MEKLSSGVIKVGLGADEDSKPELFVGLYHYCCRKDCEWSPIEGSFIEVHDAENKNRIMFHYRDGYGIRRGTYGRELIGGSLAVMSGNGRESVISYYDKSARHFYNTRYKFLSLILAPLASFVPSDCEDMFVDEICHDPESVFNNYPGKKIQYKQEVDVENKIYAIEGIIKDLNQKDRE